MNSVSSNQDTRQNKVNNFQLMLDDIKADIDRYVYGDNLPWQIVLLKKQGVWATIQYRFSRWVHYHLHIPVLRQIMKIFCVIWRQFIEMISGIELPNRAEIGKGIYIPHPYGIVIHCDAKLGENANLGQDIAIGVAGRGEKRGVPKIGDRVFIAPGAKIFGDISIGNDVAIGANAVVTKDLPDLAVAVGIPAKVISYKGSKDFIFYRGKESEQVSELVTQEQK
ncbi:MAG: serine O-acetyltransferase [Oscillatoria sp. PMC 1068.18]|nr:serine O-acetyltransferase [Oscillatoria sp. PMC 1076.18]MEC4990955.1 serine O-acetyltransferase [Oscillatoria sp. PMC 1068.18]